MIALHNNYSFKFSDTKHVYCILAKKPLNIARAAFYSVSKDNTKRVILGYTNENTCIRDTNRLKVMLNEPEITCEKMPLEDVKYIASLMKMELAVILCENNDKYEIYYSTCNSS